MPRLRRNEWNFAHNAATLISQTLDKEEFRESPLGRAEPELTELRGARRLDLVIFGRNDPELPLITGETKVPWAADGRTPYNSGVVEGAHGKASRVGALYFITWNIRRVVVWKTDDPGIELSRRVVFDKEIITGRLKSPADLDRPEFHDNLAQGVEELVSFLHTLLIGPALPPFLPLDRLFINTIEAALDHPIDRTELSIAVAIDESLPVKLEVQRWMRESQRWVVAESTMEDNIERAARFTCYVLVNRLCFYNALRRKFPELGRIVVANNINTGELLKRRLSNAFNDAKRFTGNYETVFDGDYGDNFPFLSDEAVPGWRELIRSLDRYDFAQINLDVIGSMYEQLIKPEERHRFGQHYTQPVVVDLINAFGINDGNDNVMDPSCGGGTFLVRAYARKSVLNPALDHSDLLESIYGCDVLNYACHLSLINLAIRDLIDDDNFPRIHLGDFLALRPGSVFDHQPVRIHAGGLVTETREINICENEFNAIVGNPPYIQSREMSAQARRSYFDAISREWPLYQWSRASDIYVYFWIHAERFLQENGYLGFLTQAAWLDVEYGIPLQLWMLDNFRVVAVLETEAEPWFTGARVATAVTVLQRENNEEARRNNLVGFVQFRRRLSEIVGLSDTEEARQTSFAALRDEILELGNRENENYRIRTVSQQQLLESGLDGGTYTGSKWGRYLRSTNTLYELQTRFADRFVKLQNLATVQRGITTNCDSFFIVTDVSIDETNDIANARVFRERFGVSRSSMVDGQIAIVKRRDGVKLPIEREYLRPIFRTARDYSWFNTRHVDQLGFAVFLPNDRQSSRLVNGYIRAGERERWHLSPSFQAVEANGGNWFNLRDEDVAPILFIKTMQYTPFVLLNDAEVVANQRLYKICPANDVDSEALCAVLNSTIFACERYAAVKALGKEAAIDVEVFSAKAFKTPDLRNFPINIINNLCQAMRRLLRREVGPLLEDQLIQAGHAEAVIYSAQHVVGPETWPAELRDNDRQEIDRLVLLGLGVDPNEVIEFRDRLYNDITAHTRKLRVLELEAQANRRGRVLNAEPSPQELADEMWAQVIGTGALEPHLIPSDFVPDGIDLEEFVIPAGNFTESGPNLFEEENAHVFTIGRMEYQVNSAEKIQLIRLLVEIGIKGRVLIPADSNECNEALQRMQAYFDDVVQQMTVLIEQSTADPDLQQDIKRSIIRRIIQH